MTSTKCASTTSILKIVANWQQNVCHIKNNYHLPRYKSNDFYASAG